MDSITPLAQKIANALPGNWRVQDSDDRDFARLIRADSFQIYFRQNRYGSPKDKEKLHVGFTRPRDSKGQTVDLYDNHTRVIDPSIGVSITKTPEQIANDIARRLLPEAETIFTRVSAQVAKENAAQANREALLREMTEAVGVTPNNEGLGEERALFLLPTLARSPR